MRFIGHALTLALPMLAPAAAAQETSAVAGQFRSVNAFNAPVAGEIAITPEDGQLRIRLDATGATPGMRLAHVHGFAEPDPGEAACPGIAADVDRDGFVDLIETREAAGVTMIPLTDDPASLEVRSETYPEAGEDGALSYEQTVDAEALRSAVEEEFGTVLALERRVVFLHGAPGDSRLPESVQSLEGVPAAVTMPIACAELQPAG